MKIQPSYKIEKAYPSKPFSDISYSPAKSDAGSKILLVMIQNDRNYLISHEFLASLFKAYGDVRRVFSWVNLSHLKISKILIFEKTKVLKAFIEMAKLEEAEDALANLNNVYLFQRNTEGKMKVKYSFVGDLSPSLNSLDGKGEDYFTNF